MLLRQGKIEALTDMRLGVDAVFWLRSLAGLKDPLAEAIGGLPPSLFAVLSQQVALFKDHKIPTFFVFQGLQPRSHMLFSSQIHQQIDEGWMLYAHGGSQAALSKFAHATSRINSDFVQFSFHFLKSRGCECLQAPFFATAQLAYFAEHNFLDAILGPPSLLLFGVPRVIVNIDWARGTFEWVELEQLLSTWNVTREQFMDACLLAGTEYCLTFPYLNLSQFHQGKSHFSFGTAVDFVKQAPLVSYMQHFPNEEMKHDHVDGYCVCKTLLQYPLVIQLSATVAPFVSSSSGSHPRSPALPRDFHRIVGHRLPFSVYFLMAQGILSRKIPSVLALGEWIDFSHPCVDSIEYRDLLNDVREYRCRALGLIAMRLHEDYRTRSIRFSRYTCSLAGRRDSEVESLPPKIDGTVSRCWLIDAEAVQKELRRQNCSKVDLKFCLNWHAHAQENGIPLFDERADYLSETAPPAMNQQDSQSLLALVHFMLLDNLSYFTEQGETTVFGSALMNAPGELQEDMLFVLELLKFGLLTGDVLEAPKDRPHPVGVQLLRRPDTPPEKRRSILLLSRICSLYPMRLHVGSHWQGDVDFDLAAYSSIIKILKRSLRQLTEACLGSVLLRDLTKVRQLPDGYFSPVNPKLPCVFLSRNCMGIVLKFFLEYIPMDAPVAAPQPAAASSVSPNSPLGKFEACTRMWFPCCENPLGDLCKAVWFWHEIAGMINQLNASIDVSELKGDVDAATDLLMRQCRLVGLDTHPEFPRL
ncbi:XPG N-terminal domain-containing protein [Besnoitia besnoiti]|uniref:XPG N-terminal domain-containing protein n=1 Tax=Besnoitia besnoiti TaxID=94643 RepID=A0A2A9MIS6_BESBE|nr:XPG N-terminal domain-containing protein [Besnoitia besnoiti]PFH35866.1 XPG N-terminal domain-containing protein [Besnoitia besnoiti]